MSEKVLKFRVRFKLDAKLQQQTVDDTGRKIQKFFKSVLKKLHQRNQIECGQAEHLLQDLIYSDDVYEMAIKLVFKDMDSKKELGDIFEKICMSWCCEQKEKNSSMWLIPVVSDYYHEKKAFHHDVEISEFAFGTLPDMHSFVQHYDYESKGRELLCSFYHNQKQFDLFISIAHENCSNPSINKSQKIIVQYDTILKVHINDVHGKDFTELFLHLSCPPFFYVERISRPSFRSPNGESSTSDQSSNSDYQEKRWERTLEFGCKCKKSYCSTKKIGRSNSFKIVIKGKYRARCITERLMHRCLTDTEFCFGYVQTVLPQPNLNGSEVLNFFKKQMESVVQEVQMFNCQYSWELLFSRSLEVRDQINLMYKAKRNIIMDHWGFLKSDILRYAKNNPNALCNALLHINDMLSKNVIFTFIDALRKLFAYYCSSEDDVINLPDGMCLVRRVIITPSRTVLLPPMEMFDNRIIREFPEAKEYMLRLSIQDDNFSKLTFAVQYHSQKKLFMTDVVGNVLKEGLCIGNRCYEVLASSNSQLREHGMWLYAKDSCGRTAEHIRKWMGDFSHIKNVAKYMARMGQCFSTSDEAVQISVPDKNVRRIRDIKIKTLSSEYTFSDGIGKISSALAEKVRSAREMRANKNPCENDSSTYKPSAFQIRYKGCKGMVVEDPLLTDCSLQIRPSMEKFKCDTSNKLEIVKISAPRAVYLNRPLITILEQLGVKADVFLDLQKDMILDLTDSLIYEDKAMSTLDCFLPNLNIPFKLLRESGICFTEEPFFRSLLIAVYRYSVEKLRTKARIAVPPNYGRNMLGVLDETKTLNYGEVFVQYSEQLGCNVSKTHILEGTVVVTKNPCMHPGDVRKLKAVDVPALHHIKDCIVFPANGHRPHADEMAGSDLDGDEYVVIWMPELIFSSDNYAPMQYPTNQERMHLSSIGVNEMVDFLCEFIQNDNIGTLAYAHLAWADFLREGIFSKNCMEIARKYPFVLDFAKTGKTEYLTNEEKPKTYPDFMEKGSRSNNYRSKKALGFLYRFVRNLEACVDKPDLTSYSVNCDVSLEYPGWERYLESAEQHKSQYTKTVTAILSKYGVGSEAEALSGVVKKTALNRHKQQELDNIALIVKKCMTHMMIKYRHIFFSEIENEALNEVLSVEEKKERRFQKASAWYLVVYQSLQSPVLSFAWIVSDILSEVRNKVQRIGEGTLFMPVQSSLLHTLDNSLIMTFSVMNAEFECPCITITENIIPEWMAVCKLSLPVSTPGKVCMACFGRILQHFRDNSGMECCSRNAEVCQCDFSCSPSKLVMSFMKYYLSHVVNLGKCSSCSGFRDFNLQSATLQTYISLAVTRSNKYLGVLLGEDKIAVCDDSNEEGDPVRISVSEELQNFIENDLAGMKAKLKKMTGVKDVQITIENQNNDTHYILINSTGTRWQRWDLDELIMDPDLPQRLNSSRH